MKVIKYNLYTKVNHGTEENPQIEEILSPVTMSWNEVNEEIAKKEAYKGEYEIIDDGVPEPEPQVPIDQRVENLEESSTEMQQAIDVLLLGAV